MDVEGTTVIITGAASGIGAALARRFHAEGAAALALLDLQAGPLTALADELGALAIVCDMADEAAVTAAVERVETELGPVDLCCSNAGIGGGGGVELPTAEWQRAWDVNVMAHVHLARVLVPRWIDRGHGHLLVTASAAGSADPARLRAVLGDEGRCGVASPSGSPSPTATTASPPRRCARRGCAPR